MGFFDRSNEDPERDESRERIESGGIPLAAERRLKELGAPGAPFTSGLSVSEYSLLRRLGPRPLAQVMGASVVRPGLQLLPPLSPATAIHSAQYGAPMVSSLNRITDATPSQVRNYKWRSDLVCELETLSNAWNAARRRAIDRLVEEALQVGGDAVVGVHLHRGDHDLGARMIEYVVNGTAIRLPGSTGAVWPVLTDLSVQDLWRLQRAGYDAVGLLAASIVVFASAARTTRIRRARTTRQNQELAELTNAFHAARDTLRARLRGQVSDARGDGAVGVTFSHAIRREKFSLGSSLVTIDRRGWQKGRLGIPYYVSGRGDAERPGWMITMHAAGTAVRRRQSAPMDDVKAAIRIGAR